MNNLKKCYKCKEKKDTIHFNKNVARKDNLQLECKECQKIIAKAYYKKNRKKCLAKITNNKRRRALHNYVRVVTKYLNKPCVDCKKTYHPSSMVFDHLAKYKKHRFIKTEGVLKLVREGFGWGIVKKEIDKCEVRCQNCHFYKTSKDFNYWKEIQGLIENFFNETQRKNWNFLTDEAFNNKQKQLNKKYNKLMSDRVEKISLDNKNKLK